MREKTKQEIYSMFFAWLRYIDARCEIKKIARDYIDENSSLNNFGNRLDKIEKLTHADDYEFVTETKLVKKVKDNNNI